MAKKTGPSVGKSNVREADTAYDLWLTKRRSKATKDYATYGLHAKGRRRKIAMDYVSPGDGGY